MHSFTFICTERSTDSVYLRSDHVKAISLLPPETEISYMDTVQGETYLISGRNIPLREEEIFILMNDEGALLVCQAKEMRYPSEQYESRNSSIEFVHQIIIEK